MYFKIISSYYIISCRHSSQRQCSNTKSNDYKMTKKNAFIKQHSQYFKFFHVQLQQILRSPQLLEQVQTFCQDASLQKKGEKNKIKVKKKKKK